MIENILNILELINKVLEKPELDKVVFKNTLKELDLDDETINECLAMPSDSWEWLLNYLKNKRIDNFKSHVLETAETCGCNKELNKDCPICAGYLHGCRVCGCYEIDLYKYSCEQYKEKRKND
jgi:hypothetical protein